MLKYAIYFFGFVGLYAAFHHWMELIAKFGSITKVLLNANIIYSMRVSGEFGGSLPYLYTVAYVGVFLSAIYTAHKEKLTFATLIPMVAVILKDIASVGRAGILFAFLLFFLTFFLRRYSILTLKRKNRINRRGILFSTFMFILLSVLAVTLIRAFRGQIENYNAASRTLGKYKTNLFISPSMYLYFSSNPVVLNRYLITADENKMIGENSLLPFYNLISKTGAVPHPDFYQKGFYIPIWTNQATYLREIHEDYGYFGLFAIPYLLGLMCTFYWFRYFETYKIKHLVILAFSNVVVSMGIMVIITRMAAFWIAVIILLITIPIIDKLSFFNSVRKKNKTKILLSSK